MLKTIVPIVCLTLTSVAGQDAERRPVTLQDLTVPAARLPSGCAVVPKPSEADGRQNSAGHVEFRMGPWAGLPISTNPWTGTDPNVLSRIRERMDGAAAVPDAPPPTSRELARFRLQLAEGVEEGYVAIYQQSGSTLLTVVNGLRFATDDGARMSGPIRRRPNPQIVSMSAGRIRASVSGDGSPCFQAVGAHVAALSR